jgi:hypothetical protein
MRVRRDRARLRTRDRLRFDVRAVTPGVVRVLASIWWERRPDAKKLRAAGRLCGLQGEPYET